MAMELKFRLSFSSKCGEGMPPALMDYCKNCHEGDVPFDMTETIAYKHCGGRRG
jgi:hypothetical protein